MTAPVVRDAATYVAVGAALLDDAAAGRTGVVASVVAPAALVLGSAQPEADAAGARIPVVRRGTGGGAVLCDAGTLLVDVAVPAGHLLAPDDVTDAYRPVGELLADAIGALGVAVRPATVAEARTADDARRAAARRACWAGVSPYETLLADGRKLAGLAQRRRRGAVLHQIAVPVTTRPADVAAQLADGASLAPHLVATASLAEAGWPGSPDDLWRALADPLGALVG